MDPVVSVRLTADEIASVEACWDQERYAMADGDPRITNQQYVLFDEFGTWPNVEGWPIYVHDLQQGKYQQSLFE